MNITKYLNLVFKTKEDSTSTIKIPKVKENVTEEEIKNCGKAIVDQNIFQSKNGDLSALKVARIVTTETEEIKIEE
ncbi:DUF2922 domain-containing protein [Clostridium botulinum]|uniref:DUF2922 domain-containing protein n=1 Tax=Clostridium botulinum CFSAN001627 TaxID=1232189 RepID=M1ZQ01_CLOBO|nr:DUF2922 domain-containing protein [Clostridium botulinum]EKN40916.1 hypothetical protein CFSAN001627_16473 [Clostridium botulinum CFSAN001627]MBY6756112.1 DUF2922 domain-containing protein [Clostridium botulinum]MBY6907834.1 DUF2922 domain-containing protein [Clostridium botulinum]MBY6922805.1 DUF2922 domain-containing protein [Clostridium botulinum]NFM70727.1 DUF2922 domain-containing protein [Clostridium botulinum]